MQVNFRQRPKATPPNLDDEVMAPNPWLMMLEARAPWEYMAMLAASPWLRQLPIGDGHPVIVFPGLGASDFSTLPLRGFLREHGYTPYPWGQGFNLGPREGVLEACHRLVQDVAARHREQVSLIGWSLGGIYAREMAKALPDLSRCVITLGSPFSGRPQATNAWRFYQFVSGQGPEQHDSDFVKQLRVPPPVPTTSIYSKTDGVVAWRCSLNAKSDLAENIEVQASHVGMGMNPMALYAVADRLSQPAGHWKPFEPHGARRWFFRTPNEARTA